MKATYRGWLVALFLALIPAVGVAQPPPPPPSRPLFDVPAARFRERMKELELTDEQREKLRDLHRRMGVEIRELFEKFREANRNLDELLRQYDFDRRKAEALIDEILRVQRQLLRYRVNAQAELRKILKPDQFRKLDEITRQAFQRRGPWPPDRKGPGQPPGQN
ncbi:MAG: Spy/CpxP family protein refolding chaperone [Armatimonadota bacterium]